MVHYISGFGFCTLFLNLLLVVGFLPACSCLFSFWWLSMALSTQTASASLASLAESSASRWKHDVFLSFRGEHTRRGFISHLYPELQNRGIKTFKDDHGLQIGMDISPSLLTAIGESRSAIVVLSPNYASSTRCLDELKQILQCSEANNTTVVPIFYDVDPSNVRHQRGSFAEAFTKHEVKFRNSVEHMEKVKQWRAALTKVANLSGFDSKKYGSEDELIQCIVKRVCSKVRPISIIPMHCEDCSEMANVNLGKPADFVKDVAGDFVKDVAGDFVKDVAADFVKDVAGDFVKDVAGDFIKDVAGDFIKDFSVGGNLNLYLNDNRNVATPVLIIGVLIAGVLITGVLIAVERAPGDKDFEEWKEAPQQLEMSQCANLEEKDTLKRIKLYDGKVAVGASFSATAGNNCPWLSPSGDFAFGFRQLENSDLFLLCIWFAKIPDRTIVWCANGDRPAPKGSTVTLTANSGLVLTSPQDEQLWKSDQSIAGVVAHGVMNDTGNFVLEDDKSESLWETFKNPTDTMLPGQIIERGGKLSSRQSETNYARGRFQLDFQHDDGNLVLSDEKPFYSTRTTTGTVPGSEGKQLVFDDSGNFYILRVNGGKFKFTAQERPARDYYLRTTLNFDGVLTQYFHPKSFGDNVSWKALWSEPKSQFRC